MSSVETAGSTLSISDRQTLRKLAIESIQYGLDHGKPLPIDINSYPQSLQAKRAVFVTLELHGQLRGCIGHLEAVQPLIQDVSDNAFAAAFRDPRFPPLGNSELESLEYHISVLTPAEPMAFSSEEDLLSQIQPGVDGLILEDGRHRGTFLPSVWEQLPKPEDFLSHLKQKAGLLPSHWSQSLTIKRYYTELF